MATIVSSMQSWGTHALVFIWILIFIASSLNVSASSKIDANMTISYSWTSDHDRDQPTATLEIFKRFNWYHDIHEDIVFENSFTLEEAYKGDCFLYISYAEIDCNI